MHADAPSQSPAAPPAPKAPWATPHVTRLGSAIELTRQRAMIGQMDGGANNSRTG